MTQSIEIPTHNPELVRYLIKTRQASGWILVRSTITEEGGTRLSFRRWRAPT
jgi:hypothetical protein